MKTFFALLLMALCLLASPAGAQPCQVMATFPAQGALVDAAQVTVIRVAFSSPVLTNGYSLVSDPTRGVFPQVTGKVVFESDTVCLLPVRLKPGVTYAVGVNWGKFRNFRGAAAGRPCQPYMLVFTTRP
jgi:hypothetical protein